MAAQNLAQSYTDDEVTFGHQSAMYTSTPSCVPAVEAGKFSVISFRGEHGRGEFEVLLWDKGRMVANLRTAFISDARATARTWAGVADDGIDYIGRASHRWREASRQYESALQQAEENPTPETLAMCQESEELWLETCKLVSKLTGQEV